AGHLDAVDVAAEAAPVVAERQPAAQLGLRVADASADVEPQGTASLVADPIAVGQRLERQEEAPRLDGGLEVRDAQLVVDHLRVTGEVEVAVEIGVDAHLVDGARDVELEDDLTLRLVELGLLEIEL